MFDDIVTLAEAAGLLGLSPTTLRHQAKSGRLQARLMGKTWVTTRQEVERYRSQSLGQSGRPRMAPKDDDTKTDMGAEGEDGQVYGG
jgi:excisionase family DNA binding protein